MLRHLIIFAFLLVATAVPALAASPVSLFVDDSGQIQTDDWNQRYLTGCWDSDAVPVFYYRDADGNITHAEVCNEPDETTYGLGTTPEARADNYYDFFKAERTKILLTQPDAQIVLGGLSGYNYAFTKQLLGKGDICELVDVWNFHPYHLGVAPDEIDTQKNAWHTVTQWVGFYRQLLADAGCGDMPIWVTEFGFTTADHNAEHAVTKNQQTGYALRQAAGMLAAGVERIHYFHGLDYALSDTGVAAWNDMAQELVSSRFVEIQQSGEQYCPRESTCLFDDSQYRADTGRTNWGMTNITNQLVEQNAVFARAEDYLHVSWTRGQDATTVSTSPFSDVSAHTQYADAIQQLAGLDLVSGYGDGSFGSEGAINRAEFLQMVMSAVGATTGTETNCFSDVTSEWFAPAVCSAKARGWVHGYDDGSFRPAGTISRAEATKMIVEAFGMSFSAQANSGAWYTPYVNAATSTGLLTNTEANEPGMLETRGHVAKMLSRVLK